MGMVGKVVSKEYGMIKSEPKSLVLVPGKVIDFSKTIDKEEKDSIGE